MRKSMIELVARAGLYRLDPLPGLNRASDKRLFFLQSREGFSAACELLERLDRDLLRLDTSRLAEYLEPRLVSRFEHFVEQCRLNHVSLQETKERPKADLEFSRHFLVTGMFHEREFNRPLREYELRRKKGRLDYLLRSPEPISRFELQAKFAAKYQSRADFRRELCFKANLEPELAGPDFLKHHGLLDVDCWVVGLRRRPGFSLVAGDQSARVSFAEDKTTVARVEKVAMPYETRYYLADLDQLLAGRPKTVH